ncbi:hypothetical protein CRYUN_Cryun19dG0094700 [Craigia yunnanensis]
MGVIKDGRVSGTLPNDESFAVHYPGYPKTTARAIQTLGGIQGILKARSSQLNKLEHHFRPEYPYSHPAFGDLRPCNNMLLKISKKKCSNGQTAEASVKLQECSTSGATVSKNQKQPSQVEAQIPEEEQTNLCADPAANSMLILALKFDFSFVVKELLIINMFLLVMRMLPGKEREIGQKQRNRPLVRKRWVHGCGSGGCDDDIAPALFIQGYAGECSFIALILGRPKCKKRLRPSTILSSKKKQEGVVRHSAEVPKKVNWKELITRGSEQWEWQMTVSKLFDERPIWPKESVTERLLEKGLKFSHLMLKRLLLGVAYYFSNGPFLSFWIKKGYDPHKDPDSRIYQRTEFRVPEPFRSYADANATNKLKHKWRDLCSFRVFPYKCQTFLQLFELDDDYIQQEIRKPPKLATCSSKTGWFSECVLDCLRLRVAVRFLSVYPETGADSILKSYSDEFEKLKRSCIYKDVLNPHQEEHHRGDDEERPKSSDDEEGEIEADDEEELDVYETLNLVGGEDDEIPLQSDACILESCQSVLWFKPMSLK